MTISETIAAIIIDDPLYKKRLINGRLAQNDIGSFKPINYHCEGACQSIQTFTLDEVNTESPSEYQQDMRQLAALSHVGVGTRSLIKYADDTDIYHLKFVCLKCRKYHPIFTLMTEYQAPENTQGEESGTTTIQKTGQFPPQESSIDADVGKWLPKSDKELYTKGIRSEANGYGIGAYGYFRRIVENNISLLLDQISDTTDDPDLVKAVVSAKQQHNASEKLNIIKDHAPGSYTFNGQNVFKVLYGALSDGIHDKSDDDCLSAATSVRVCLDFLIKRVYRAAEEQKLLEESLKKLTS